MNNNIAGILDFIKGAENLKNTLRYAFTSAGRQESAAEHSWRLCLFIMACAHRVPSLDCAKLLKLAVIHDLAEAICGDTPAVCRKDHEEKSALERQALLTITQPLPEAVRDEFIALWEEYEAGATEEARHVKALDKLETLLQHTQGENPPDFDYAFNLTYGLEQTGTNDLFCTLRERIDEATRACLDRGKQA